MTDTDVVFATLAEPHRRLMIEALGIRPHGAGEFADLLPLAQPTISKHLRTLQEGGFVDVRSQAQRRVYSLRTGPLIRLDDWLSPFRAAWEERLDALERHLDAHEPD